MRALLSVEDVQFSINQPFKPFIMSNEFKILSDAGSRMREDEIMNAVKKAVQSSANLDELSSYCINGFAMAQGKLEAMKKSTTPANS